MTACIVCDASLSVDERTQVNEIIVCSDCGTELEITGLNPVSVAAAPQEQEDWGE
jgi:alpha-aminoadipate carrier protein LysW